ncbi:hypothetical protein PsorP6_017016 [Peronosclerospora sorghi]|uniref:Uncharacterized protein n=1 Tax=Peronosclerospora sorghi TaxID=230839 RepID=A0ACC0WG88_9STRA|nr:hypothetical protein PsorP6_017016 [Peronosclerospora sorghi]
MKVVERDAQYNPVVFGDKEKQIRDTSNYEFEVRLEIAAALIPSPINLKNMKIAVIFCRSNGLRRFGLVLPADAVRQVFTRIQACIQSMHFLVAQEACNMCRNFQIISVYLSRDHVVREKIASVLHETPPPIGTSSSVRSPTSVLTCS